MLSSMSRWLNSVKNENALTWKALPGKSLLLHFPSSETIRRNFARRARNGAYKADWNKWISYKAFENFYTLIHVTECRVYRVWLSVIIPFAKTICCYLVGAKIFLISALCILYFFFVSRIFRACLPCVKLFPACYGSREQRLYSQRFPQQAKERLHSHVLSQTDGRRNIAKFVNFAIHAIIVNWRVVSNVMISVDLPETHTAHVHQSNVHVC